MIDSASQRWRLETVQAEALEKDPREDYFVLSGEALCQYLLRRHPDSLVIARGPLPFLSGNKASIGYFSPLTGLPHYSFVGGRAAAQLLNLGLDAICFQASLIGPGSGSGQAVPSYIVLRGRAPELRVEWKPAADLPAGQRSAFYCLLERELGGDRHSGSIFTLGEAARLGYQSANLAADAIYHAGRGGAGAVFSRFARGLVLHGQPLELSEFFAGDDSPFAQNPNAAITTLLDKYVANRGAKTGGTIVKMLTSGANPSGRNTLPAWNARQLGYRLADIGGPQVLKATRQGQTGCHWCQVDCRHWHWVPAEYAPGGRDIFLDDFEPTYALLSMLGLLPSEDSFQGRLDLLAEVNERLILPVEQLGCDVIDVGVGLAALLEGLEHGIVPSSGAPGFMAATGLLGPSAGAADEQAGAARQRLEAAAQAVGMLRSGQAANYPALRAVGDGPQALAQHYPPMQDIVFTSGKGTLGNAGHCNALWTFLMPFSRFFGHLSGQLYKVEEELPPPGSDREAYRACFERVVRRLLAREFFWGLCNALSMCAFTFVVFSQDGKGERLSEDDLLVRVLRNYGIHTSRGDLVWFSEAFWAQSIAWKCHVGWRPPAEGDLPHRVYEALSLALGLPAEELRYLMSLLIEEWKRQAGETLVRFGYAVPW